jgi:hypothetical protein
MYKKITRLFNIILYHLYIRQNHPDREREIPYCILETPLTKECWQRLNRLVEKSGVKDKKELLAHSLTLFEMAIDHELSGKKIKMLEHNEVDGEFLDLLDQTNNQSDWWRDE